MGEGTKGVPQGQGLRRTEHPRGATARLALTPRAVQVALGWLWILDGLLKFQPDLWRAGFVHTVIAPNAEGQPAPLSWVVTHLAGLLAHGQAAWVVAFGLIELAIGVGLLFRPTVRPALFASFVWAVMIWLVAEGLGGVLTGQASPIMGSPGTAYLYALLGALVWPTRSEPKPASGLASSAVGRGRFGAAGGLTLWCGVWFVQALLWLLPANRGSSSVPNQIAGMAQGQPEWYGHALASLGHALSGGGTEVAFALAAASLVVAVGPLISRRPEAFIVGGLVLGFVYWATGEAFGGLLTLSATDPGNWPPLLLLGLGLLPATRAEQRGPSIAAIAFERHRYLSTVVAAGAAACSLAVGLVPATAQVAQASSTSAPPSTAQQEAGMARGQPLVEPKNLNVATPAVLNLRLVAERTRFDIGGKRVWGESYNGDFVGPTMHFIPGEKVNLTLVNKLPTATNLHFHGMHISPSGSADNPYISVAPGTRFTYHFTIPMDQPIGTFWYHDHDMCMGSEEMAMPGMPTTSTPAPHCQDIETQIYNGLSGTIIVGNDRTLLPSDLQSVQARTLAFKDIQITPSGHIVKNTASYAIDSNAPTVRLVNGQLQPTVTMRPGQTELWRLANEGADIFYNLDLPGYSFTVVGQDGYPVSEVTTANTLLLPPAKRWDVLVTAPEQPGTSWLRTLAYSNGPQGDSYPQTKLMKVVTAGQPEQPAAMPTGALPTSLPSLASAHIARYRSLWLSENAAGTVMYINGKQFNPNRSIFKQPAVLGTTEQWTVYNQSGEIHPFHIHTDHFQVMSINGVPQPYTGEQDIIPVPHKVDGKPGQVVLRIHFTDFTGKVMFHCHIAAHEDAGMMSFVNVVAPPQPGHTGS